MALHDIHCTRRNLRLRVGVTTWPALLPLDFKNDLRSKK